MSGKNKTVTFEDAIDRLEAIIDSMESGNIPLAELTTKFEEGALLLKACRNQLQEAESKIEKLNMETGELETFKHQEGQDS